MHACDRYAVVILVPLLLLVRGELEVTVLVVDHAKGSMIARGELDRPAPCHTVVIVFGMFDGQCGSEHASVLLIEEGDDFVPRRHVHAGMREAVVLVSDLAEKDIVEIIH